jgi:hypothetical protein
MATKPTQLYRTAKGAHIDMLKLVKQNEMVIAVGNAKVNARGDKLGPGGVIIKKREEIASNAPVVPEQLSVRAVEASQPTVKSTPVKPMVKDVSDMDPEGKE